MKEWGARKSCRKELDSLLGHLQHAATVICPGRTFVCRLIGLVGTFQGPLGQAEPVFSLTPGVVADIHGMLEWDLSNAQLSTSSGSVVSDASGTWCCGAHWGTSRFQWRWEGPAKEWDIAAKELLNYYCTCGLGRALEGKAH